MASNKLRAVNKGNDDGAEMDMSPMIDMVFLLLIFFIVVSTPINVKQDPNVNPSIAYNALDSDEGNGRIVINVLPDGTYTKKDYEADDGKMSTPEEITAYVTEQSEIARGLDYTPRIHLRGDDDALFKYSQTVLKAAGEAGVNSMIFSVYPFAK